MKTAMFTTVFTMFYHCKRKYIYLLIYVKTISEMNYKQLLLSEVCGKGDGWNTGVADGSLPQTFFSFLIPNYKNALPNYTAFLQSVKSKAFLREHSLSKLQKKEKKPNDFILTSVLLQNTQTRVKTFLFFFILYVILYRRPGLLFKIF